MGGTLTARRFIYQTTFTIDLNGEDITTVEEEDAPKAPGTEPRRLLRATRPAPMEIPCA